MSLPIDGNTAGSAETPGHAVVPLVDGPHFDGPHFEVGVPTEEAPPWTEIEAGRFMPRRIRGSYQGRALG